MEDRKIFWTAGRGYAFRAEDGELIDCVGEQDESAVVTWRGVRMTTRRVWETNAAERYTLARCWVPDENGPRKRRRLNLQERITVHGILVDKPWIMRGGQQYIRQFVPGFVCMVQTR